MKVLITGVVLLMLLGCTSAPYVVRESIDVVRGMKTETVCTHKTYVIPFYIVVAAGVFTFDGDRKCREIITRLP